VETSKPSVSSHSIEVSKVEGYYINKYRRGLNIRWDPTGTRARSKNMMEAFQYSLMNDDGKKSKNPTTTIIASLYQGYTENILYGFPADIIKFVTYDNLSGGKKDLSPIVGAFYGAISTGIAQCVTTPLDVARNRIMAEVKDNNATDNIDKVDGSKMSYMERLVKIAKEEGVEALFAGTTPRIAKAMLSGALQFAAYEETKQKVTEMFLRR